MKALTIRQPWLYCITDLDKRVENRTWKPPGFIIGQRIALHSSKKLDDEVSCFQASDIAGIKLSKQQHNMPLGCIVATAVVYGWIDGSSNSSTRFRESKWFFGPIGWILSDVQKLDEPIPCRGALGLWEVPIGIVLK